MYIYIITHNNLVNYNTSWGMYYLFRLFLNINISTLKFNSSQIIISRYISHSLHEFCMILNSSSEVLIEISFDVNWSKYTLESMKKN